MANEPAPTPQASVAVVGVGYWGKNLVRNFYDLGALSVLCDAQGPAGPLRGERQPLFGQYVPERDAKFGARPRE